MASTSTGDERGTPPVFIPCRNLPETSDTNNDKTYTVREICAAAEKTSGYNTVIGAQRIGSLWRIYPRTPENRASLLLSGIEIRNRLITPNDKNPFIVHTPQGQTEAPTTKLIIGNLPISYSNQEIEAKLLQLGCQLQSKLLMERDRDDKGGLTRWLTGRRFAYIRIPDRPLPEKITIGPATATLYHREQKLTAQNAVCSRCFATGHRAASCVNQIVCNTCRQSGHKKGHPSCPLTPHAPDADVGIPSHSPPEDQTTVTTSADQSEKRTISSTSSPSQKSPAKTSTPRRGRTATTQSRLSFNSRSQSRSREKRPRESPAQPPEVSKNARKIHDSERREDAALPEPKQGGGEKSGT